MNMRMKNCYAILDDNDMCYCIMSTDRDFDSDRYIPISEHNEDYMEKYYYSDQWWERVYDTDEDGNPLDTYTDIPWPPKG